MRERTGSERDEIGARIARRNYAIFCAAATAAMAGMVGGVVALFLQ